MAPLNDAFELQLTSFTLTLRVEGKSPKTISTYMESTRQLFVHAQGLGRTGPDEITRDDVRSYLAELQDAGRSDSTVSVRYRSLMQWAKVALEDGDITLNPIDGIRPPAVAEKPVPVLSDDQVTALLKKCDTRSFEGLRDRAIIHVLADTGLRRAELLHLAVDDLTFGRDEVTATVLGKGNRVRTVDVRPKAAKALLSYLKIRAKHRDARDSHLWLGKRGALGESGLRIMLKKRGDSIGLAGLHPHQFRHTAAHNWLADSGTERGLMQHMAWRSPAMLSRYAASTAAERARAEHRRLGSDERYGR